jgi:enterochelin esterase family protein
MPVSPRLLALHRALQFGRQDLLDTFWQEIAGTAPLIEPIAGDEAYRLVTFIWRGDDQTRRVRLYGGWPAPEPKLLVQLHQTDLWYRTERHPIDARFGYDFQVNGPAGRGTTIMSTPSRRIPSLPVLAAAD